MGNGINFLKELIFPDRCPGCDKVLTPDERKTGYCRECRNRIGLIGEDYCLKCGKPLLYGGGIRLCRDCQNIHHSFAMNRALYIYEGDMKKTMYRFKYMNRGCYAKIFARDAELYLGEYFDSLLRMGLDALIPVPMNEKKKRTRGYNQAECLADELGRKLELPVLKDAVIRVRDTKGMKFLDPKERRRNLNKAFQYIETGVELNRVLLTDDIYTTGATVDAISSLLMSKGVSEVYSVCVCIGCSN